MANVKQCTLSLTHPSHTDFDLRDVLRVQRERVGRNNSRAGQEDGSAGKTLAAKEKSGELIEGAFDLTDARLAREDRHARPGDGEAHVPLSRRGFGGIQLDPRTQRAGAMINLGLGQVQQVLAFDVARTPVVADRKARQLALLIEHQGQPWQSGGTSALIRDSMGCSAAAKPWVRQRARHDDQGYDGRTEGRLFRL